VLWGLAGLLQRCSEAGGDLLQADDVRRGGAEEGQLSLKARRELMFTEEDVEGEQTEGGGGLGHAEYTPFWFLR
jgi:hypothetical protein